MKINYTIKDNILEDKDNTIIIASGITREFPISEIKQNIKQCEKMIREFTANANLQDAIANNVLKHNEELIKGLSEEELNAISMYFNAKKSLKEYSDKVKEIDEVLGLELEDLNTIYKQFPELKIEASAEVVNGEVKLNEN